MRFTHIGLGDWVSTPRVVALIQPGTTTGRRHIRKAKQLCRYLDCAHGRGIKCYVLMDDDTVIASHITAATIASRLNEGQYDPAVDRAIKDDVSVVSKKPWIRTEVSLGEREHQLLYEYDIDDEQYLAEMEEEEGLIQDYQEQGEDEFDESDDEY